MEVIAAPITPNAVNISVSMNLLVVPTENSLAVIATLDISQKQANRFTTNILRLVFSSLQYEMVC